MQSANKYERPTKEKHTRADDKGIEPQTGRSIRTRGAVANLRAPDVEQGIVIEKNGQGGGPIVDAGVVQQRHALQQPKFKAKSRTFSRRDKDFERMGFREVKRGQPFELRRSSGNWAEACRNSKTRSAISATSQTSVQPAAVKPTRQQIVLSIAVFSLTTHKISFGAVVVLGVLPAAGINENI